MTNKKQNLIKESKSKQKMIKALVRLIEENKIKLPKRWTTK